MRKKSKELTILALMAVLIFAVIANCKLAVNAAEGDVEINETNFPDEAFRTYVSENRDTDKDGSLSRSEISATEYMWLVGDEYTSLQGIEYFTLLREMNAGGKKLTSLDVSKNINLIGLNCRGGNLRELVVNSGLEHLECDDNNLSYLDLSKNTGLVELYCNNNRLSSLDLSNCPELNQFSCSENKLVLDFVDEGFEIEGLDVSRITSITGAKVVGTKIVPDEGSKKITYTYDIKNQNLENPTFTLIKSVHMEDVVIDEENFPDGNFRSYVTDYCDTDGNGKLSGEELLNKTKMELYSSNIASLKGIEHFFALESLNLNDNSLTSLDVSKNVELVSLDCSMNQLESLNVSGNAALEYLNCDNNCLNSLNVAENAALTTLYCYDNNLSGLDVSKNVVLKKLYCDGNSLSSLDVSRNTMLESLSCSNNKLDKLDVSRNTGLKSLYCSSNNLSSLEVSGNTKLGSLACDGNNLGGLDVSNNTALWQLVCYNTGLSSLDVSKNKALICLNCSSNNLAELNISNNTALEELYCSENRLKSLDLSNHAALMYLYCNNNKLSSLDLSQCLALEELECNGNELPVAFVAEGFTVEGLDVSRMSNLTGAAIDIEGGLIVPNAGDSEITYTYDVKNSSVENPAFKLVAASHEHSYGTEWKSDEKTHWHECVCGEKSDVHAHTPGAAATCTTAQTCTECGKVLKEAAGHSFGKEWKSDGHSHWHECACGEKSDVAVHTPGEAADCDSAQTCTVCGRILEEAAEHTFGTEWKSDEENHWHECTCGEKSDVTKHTPVTKVTTATFTKAGSLVTQCSVCKKVIKTENIPAIKTVELSQSIYVYDGKIKTPVLAIKDSKGKTIASKYYTVKKASGRKDVGSYTYKITFKGNYKGTKTLTFAINPKETKISSLVSLSKGFTIKWAKQDKQTTGYQFRYSLKTDMSNAKMVTVNKNTILTKTVKRLQANKKYYVQVRTYKTVAGKKYYSEWSKTGTVKTKK